MPRIYLSPPHMSGHELELVNGAFATNWIAPPGPHVDAFGREFAAAVGVPHAAAPARPPLRRACPLGGARRVRA
jgi:pyridoxal phosphate-dependent aminotransferase EpsN